jgi:hypothetical protein
MNKSKWARIVVRSDGKVIIGGQSTAPLLKPNTVYELTETPGDEESVQVKEVGEACLKPQIDLNSPGSSHDFCWGNDIAHLLTCLKGRLFLSKKEEEEYLEKRPHDNL